MQRFPAGVSIVVFTALVLQGRFQSLGADTPRADGDAKTFVIDFAKPLGTSVPRTGFLGGLRDETPDALIEPLHPRLWRIGHQFNGRIAGGLPSAVARVEKAGAAYKLVMSDLISSKLSETKDWAGYEAAVQKLVERAGDRASSIIWEPVNEPDAGHHAIEAYYELYAHAFKAVRHASKDAALCGPSFAFPSYEKYKAFLDYCRENHLECNDLSWHYTGWDPHAPEQQKWQLGRMREFLKDYPEQKIQEIHCDEWGAGPDKPTPEHPGRLQPGLALVWFYYLEDVYKVDRACRANWGKADDYLGGIITPGNEPYPVYHAYRFYGSTAGMRRVAAEPADRAMAVLAYRSDAPAGTDRQILLGSIAKGTHKVSLDLRDPAIGAMKLEVQVLHGTHVDAPMAASQVPTLDDFTIERRDAGMVVTLHKVEENDAYRLRFSPEKR